MQAVTCLCLEKGGCGLVPVWRMQAVTCLCLEKGGCDLAPVWRMQAVTLLLSGECRL